MLLKTPLVLALSWLTVFTRAASLERYGLPARPVVLPRPYSPGKGFPVSHPRDPKKICYVPAGKCGGEDDAPAIKQYAKKCNNGGTVVFDKEYVIASPIDLTFLKHVDIVITGTISFKADIPFWIENSYHWQYQNVYTFWKIGGKDINIYGGGTIDGRGQAWWDMAMVNTSAPRPSLVVFDGLEGGAMSHLKLINSPIWFVVIANSTDYIFSDLDISSRSVNASLTRNSDAFDTFYSDNIVIQNSKVFNSDDCVSYKRNSTNIVVQNMDCTGSHGVSVGSLGQYLGEVEVAENLYTYNVTLTNATDGARIKVWPGVPPGTTTTDTGGGSGHVRNITYNNVKNINNLWAIEITQCYGVSNTTICQEHPSNMKISDIFIHNMTGTTSTKNDPKVGTIVCSSPEQCSNFQFTDIDVHPPSGKPPVWICSGLDTSGFEGFTCVDP